MGERGCRLDAWGARLAGDLELFLGADTVLCPGDHVALMGTDSQLEAAEALFA